MKKVFCVIAILFLQTGVAYSQNANVKPCSAPEANQFDFWLGNWNLTYNDTMHASNQITKELESCVIHEHFKDPATKYFGESWSVYNPKTKKWQQTWVDSQGGYIVLTGIFEKGAMTLFTEPTIDATGKKIQYRMLFTNISAEKFDWKWDLTNDEGKTWKTNWAIHYQRAK